MSTKHFTKSLGLAVATAIAIGAFATASASALPTWTVEGTKQANGYKETVDTSLTAGSTATLEGTLLGQAFVLTSTSLTDSGAYIEQNATNGAAGGGVLEFSGITVDKPAGCVVASPIKTKALLFLRATHGASIISYDAIIPASGNVLATIKVEKCAIAGSYNWTTFYWAGEGEEWGKSLVNQPLNFSPTINSTLGGTLNLGGSAAKFDGEMISHLTGANAGKTFGAVK